MEVKKEKKAKRPKLEYDDVYEVEKIVDHAETAPNKYLYSVKWKGWAKQHNTWEPLDSLNCDIKLAEYLKTCMGQQKSDDVKVGKMKVSLMGEFDDASKIDALLEEFTVDGKLKIPEVDLTAIQVIAEYLASIEEEKWDFALRDKLKQMLDLEFMSALRATQLETLKAWENQINSVPNTFKKMVPLKVVNDVDLEGVPPRFNYVHEYVCGKGIVIPSDPLVGCDCGERCKGTAKKCCALSADSTYAYHGGKLRIDPGMPIYECNMRCSCTLECANRVIQHGRLKKLAIFRTSNNCGWGVKTLEKIKKGTFITQYVGEVIDNEEAEKRGLTYDAAGRTYLFDLDFNGKEAPYTVDATAYGNESHFINHSCDPNTAIYAAFINCLDPNLPLLAIFSIRDIEAGEEITFDYSSQRSTLDDSIASEEEKISEEGKYVENYLCKCGAATCRKYLFT